MPQPQDPSDQFSYMLPPKQDVLGEPRRRVWFQNSSGRNGSSYLGGNPSHQAQGPYWIKEEPVCLLAELLLTSHGGSSWGSALPWAEHKVQGQLLSSEPSTGTQKRVELDPCASGGRTSEHARGPCSLAQGWCPPGPGHTHQSIGGHSIRSRCCGRNLSPLVSPCSFRDCKARRSFPGAAVQKERRKGRCQLVRRQWGPLMGGVGPPPNACVSVPAPQGLRSWPPLETGWKQVQSVRKRSAGVGGL